MTKLFYRRIFSLASFILIACAIAFLVIERRAPTLAVGHKAPINHQISLLNGSQVTIRYLLNKPMVINFWATWCPPCHEELPMLNHLAKKYDQKVTFLGLAIDSPVARGDLLPIDPVEKRVDVGVIFGGRGRLRLADSGHRRLRIHGRRGVALTYYNRRCAWIVSIEWIV